MGSATDGGYWPWFQCWHQPGYERLRDDLSETARTRLDRGPNRLNIHPDAISDPIEPESFAASNQGVRDDWHHRHRRAPLEDLDPGLGFSFLTNKGVYLIDSC